MASNSSFSIHHDPLQPPAVLGQIHLKQTQPAGICKYAYAHSLIQTPHQLRKRWGNATGVTRPKQTIIKTPHYCVMSFLDWLS